MRRRTTISWRNFVVTIAVAWILICAALYWRFQQSDPLPGARPADKKPIPVDSATPQPVQPLPLTNPNRDQDAETPKDPPVVPLPPPRSPPPPPPPPPVVEIPVQAITPEPAPLRTIPQAPNEEVPLTRKLKPAAPMASPAIVVVCYNRPHYLKQTLASITDLQPLQNGYAVYISQDGDHEETSKVAQSFPKFHHWNRPRTPLLSPSQGGVAYLAQHYKYALDRVFLEFNHSHAILVEDDLLLSPDFLRFFEATAPLLDQDPTLWCVSSWNDNGFSHLVSDPALMYRTSYFPGLGWMMRRQLWLELGPKWPLTHWDHWMRVSTTHRGRECVAPSISRNKNIGQEGVHINNQAFASKLQNIAFNEKAEVDYGDLSYLMLDNYRAFMHQTVAAAKLVATDADMLTSRQVAELEKNRNYLVVVRRENFPSLAGIFGIWDVWRSSHQRTQIVTSDDRTFILADSRWSPYVPSPLRVMRHPALQVVAGARAEACTQVCQSRGSRCLADQFDFINDCEELARYFPCETGCSFETGSEIPVYVSDPGHDNRQKCLVTEEFPTCEASHHSTSRLCPCGPA